MFAFMDAASTLAFPFLCHPPHMQKWLCSPFSELEVKMWQSFDDSLG